MGGKTGAGDMYHGCGLYLLIGLETIQDNFSEKFKNLIRTGSSWVYENSGNPTDNLPETSRCRQPSRLLFWSEACQSAETQVQVESYTALSRLNRTKH